MPMEDFNLKHAILAAMRQEPLPITESKPLQHLSEATLEECRKLVVSYVQRRIPEVLSFMPGSYPEPQQSLNDLGFNSMRAMELRHRIETELEVGLPAEVFIGTSTIAKVARFLLDQLILSNVIQSASSTVGPDDDLDEVAL